MPDANPNPGPYTAPATTYHVNPAKYSKVVLAAATFYATGSNANPSAFYVTGSAGVTVTLADGAQLAIPAPTAATPAQVYEVSVQSVTTGTVYLLYR